MTPPETDPVLLVSVQESPAEGWLAVACCRVMGTEGSSACTETLEGGHPYLLTPTIVWSQAKQQGGNTVLPINRKLD